MPNTMQPTESLARKRCSELPGSAAAPIVLRGSTALKSKTKTQQRRPQSARRHADRAPREEAMGTQEGTRAEGQGNGRKPRPPTRASLGLEGWRPPPRRSTRVSGRPGWDDTPMRPRPSAMRGLLEDRGPQFPPKEPFARDEEIYNRRLPMWSSHDGHFDPYERVENLPWRLTMLEMRQVRAMVCA